MIGREELRIQVSDLWSKEARSKRVESRINNLGLSNIINIQETNVNDEFFDIVIFYHKDKK